MQKGDTQLATPQALYKGTKAAIEALTGVPEGAIAYATDTNELGSYDGSAWTWGQGNTDVDVTETFKLSGVISATLTGDHDDWNPTGLADAAVIRITGNSGDSISGIEGGTDGRVLMLLNVGTGTNNIVLLNNDVGSSVENRFLFPDQLSLDPNKGVAIIYDGTSERWRQLSRERSIAELQVLIYAAITVEYVQDIAGGMVAGGTEIGVVVTYNDAAGVFEFDAQTPGDARYAPIAKGVTGGDGHNHVGGDGAALTYTDSLLIFGNGATVPASSTWAMQFGLTGTAAVVANLPYPIATTLRDLIFRTSGTQPASGTLVVTLVLNGVDTALTITVPAGGASNNHADNTHEVVVAAGDTVRWKLVNNATGSSATIAALTCAARSNTA